MQQLFLEGINNVELKIPTSFCPTCSFIDKAISNSSEECHFTFKNEHSNPIGYALKNSNFLTIDILDEFFSTTFTHFCGDCSSVVTENIYIENANEAVSRYSITPIYKFKKDEVKDIKFKLVINFFNQHFHDVLDNNTTFLYDIQPFNFGIPSDCSNEDVLKESILKFTSNDFFTHLYLDFDTVPITSLVEPEFYFDQHSVVRFKTEEKNITFNPYPSKNNLEEEITQFSFKIKKDDIISTEFYDFFLDKWIDNLDEEGISNLIQNNQLFFSGNPPLSFNYFTLNSFIKNKIK